ncbi:MAG: hypothetical protein AVDCRST_MAG11-140 [uncultured Gemmatimonadaceae bacterium]|uniref:Uncharacterized protein n=1 Tax=uncultured Gemmatimonadaceae bacterium TaxID=246130 RepID=A0A6J4JYY3_9BACT|nr:MAG: hypothetical protein AVDCRST_MAG11-140 [uncultured Gemmatimonadaceae bacterium]
MVTPPTRRPAGPRGRRAGVTSLGSVLLLVVAALGPAALAAQRAGDADYAAATRAAAEQRWAAAARAMERAVQARPDHAEYHYWLGRAYVRQAAGGAPWTRVRLARRAVGALERAISLDSTHDAAYGELIPAYAQLPAVAGGDRARADALLAQWLRVRPYTAGLARLRFDVARDRPHDALAHAAALARTFPDSARPHAELAIAYQRASRFAEARPMVERALARWPDDPRLLFAVGRAAAETGEQLARGDSALRRVLAAGPGVDDQLRANARYRLGRILERRGDRAGARAEYDSALALAPALRDARTARARVR